MYFSECRAVFERVRSKQAAVRRGNALSGRRQVRACAYVREMNVGAVIEAVRAASGGEAHARM